MLQVSLFGQTLCRVEQFATADRSAPDTYVVAVLQLGEVGEIAVGVQVIHLLLTCQVTVACQCDNLHTRGHDEKGHVETNLVVASTGRAVGDGVGTNFLGIAGNGNGLENAFAGDADGIAVVAKHIAENHVFQRLLIIFLCHVKGYVFHGA